uniref:Uncharacterized protein isoform X2 n=1 Tax=Nicotiana tabacum TaxID=4097 RepID=A0A1S3X8U8_TOBAC|nr:PREDICTED: uncharacterized protein LOC107762373 isoform X2 [Nicotiana tabacum]
MLLNSSSLNSYRKSSLPYRVFFFSSSSSPCPRVIRMNLEENSSQLNLEIRKLACRSRCLRGRVRAFQSFSNCRGFRDSTHMEEDSRCKGVAS